MMTTSCSNMDREDRTLEERQVLEDLAQEQNTSADCLNQVIGPDVEPNICYICQKSTEEDKRLKKFVENTWETTKNAAASRADLKSDIYSDSTSRILSCNDASALGYHPACQKRYTAVKRKHPDPPFSDVLSKKAQIETRQCSSLPKSNQQGLLKGECIFCGKTRKKIRGKEENLVKIATLTGCQSLLERANESTNDRIKSLIRSGVNLIAKEAEYHKSCRAQFLVKTSDQIPSTSTQEQEGLKQHQYHKIAFTSLCTYIETEVIENQRSVSVAALLEMYRAEYASNGGDEVDIISYQTQSLKRKIRDHFKQRVNIMLVDQRTGNIIYCSGLTEEDAVARLHNDAERHKQDDKLRWAALHLRSLIMQLPKTKTPNPVTVQNLKECAPDIPKQLDQFFRNLLCGSARRGCDAYQETIDRKVTAMASDAIYNATRGIVKPWKHTVVGLGLGSLTGSKLSLQILNRAGHCINYSETKGLETEFAYSVQSEQCDAPDGIHLDPSLATACVWDNNDANIETLDGKATLHATVGHTYQNVLNDDRQLSFRPIQFRDGRNRRTFQGQDHSIPSFRKPLNKAQFACATATTETADKVSSTPEPTFGDSKIKIALKALDIYWFWRLEEGNTPMHAGFFSKYIRDTLPLQRICYMDPIPRSPTNNDVVRETMIRTMNVAKETGQNYAVVTYDLAVALKAYSIQAIERPLFDKLLVMLGNFHIELAFYGAVGTLINESGIEYVLSEAGVLAEGSMMGFIKGKFYNRCTRIHELLATVLEKKLYARFLMTLDQEECEWFEHVMSTVPSNPKEVEAYLSDPVVTGHLQKYEDFFQRVIHGSHGPAAQFWATYIFLINRLHRELQRCVKTNDVSAYIGISPAVLDVFFALNRPNYARWGTLFLKKLESAQPELREILDQGAFSIRRTKKDYSRSAVDLSLEQSVNRDAASQMKGIVAFRNSENAMRRWSLAMTQRAAAVTELRTFAGLEVGEHAAAQCRHSRVRKDNNQMAALSSKIDEFCNPFSEETSDSLVNIATGRIASKATETYLLNTLERGQVIREKFQSEWESNNSRLLERVKRVRVQNFATENGTKKTKSPALQMAKTNAESLRDVFVRMIVVLGQNSLFDLRNALHHPITKYPLSLAHSDGSIVKTEKSALLNKLESMQTELITDSDIPRNCTYIHDGGLVLHSIISQTNPGASFASIARTILSSICSGQAKEVHLCLDKYVENSIKDSERKMRGALDDKYVISGPEQTTRQSGDKLLKNGVFKNELGKFLLSEWGRDHYWNIFGGKTLFASYGGMCCQYVPDDTSQKVNVTKPVHLQGDHEEADTLIAFHVWNVSTGEIVVRASDTDVLVILIGALGQQRSEERSVKTIIMDCGMGNSRRYINVTNIVESLEHRKPGLSRALPGYHAFSGCDFTSAFYRKGKVKALDIIAKDQTGRYVDLFINLGDTHGKVDFDVASDLVCRIYAQSKCRDVDEARYYKLVQMTGKISEENPLENVKKIDCALLPPSRRCLEMKLHRVNYVTMLWQQASSSCPGYGLAPTDYGWKVVDDLLQPIWFNGAAIPGSLFKKTGADMTENDGDSDETIIVGNECDTASVDDSDDEPWTEDSDSDPEDIN